MKSDDFGFSSTVVRCTFDGENLIYKEHGDELILKQGRGIYEPSITSFKGEYYLTMRSDKSALLLKAKMDCILVLLRNGPLTMSLFWGVITPSNIG